MSLGLGVFGSHIFANYTYKIDNKSSISNSVSGLLGYPPYQASQSFSSNDTNVFHSNSNGNSFFSNAFYKLSFYRDNTTKISELNFIYFLTKTILNEDFDFYFSDESTINDISSTNNGYQYFSLNFHEDYFLSSNKQISYDIGTYYIPVFNTTENTVTNGKNDINIFNYNAKINYNFKNRKTQFDIGGYFDFSNYNTYGNIQFTDNTSNETNFKGIQNQMYFYIDSKYKLTTKSKISLGAKLNYFLFMYDSHKNSFFNPFYNIGYSYKIGYKSTLSIDYTKRMQSPNLQQLLPVYTNQNIILSDYGNQSLSPALSNNFNISFSSYFYSNYIRISTYYKNISSSLSKFIEPTINNITSKYINLDKEENYGINLWLTSYFFMKKISVNCGLNFLYKDLYYLNLRNDGFQFLTNLNIGVDLKKNWTINLFGNFNTQNIHIQGNESIYTYSNLSLQKTFLNNKLRFAISVDDPFRDGFRLKQVYEIENSIYNSTQFYRTRSIRIFLTYQFGRKSKKEHSSNFMENTLQKQPY